MRLSDSTWSYSDSRWEDVARSLGTNRSGVACVQKFRYGLHRKRKCSAVSAADAVEVSQAGAHSRSSRSSAQLDSVDTTGNRHNADGNEYAVESILGRRCRQNQSREYKIRWLGYGPEADTWEPIEHLASAHTLVSEFDRCEKLIGKRVRKKFIGCGVFEGTVTGHRGGGMLDVRYDDGEKKRVKLNALLKILI